MISMSSPLKDLPAWRESVNFVRYVEDKAEKSSKQTSFQMTIGSACTKAVAARALYNLLGNNNISLY